MKPILPFILNQSSYKLSRACRWLTPFYTFILSFFKVPTCSHALSAPPASPIDKEAVSSGLKWLVCRANEKHRSSQEFKDGDSERRIERWRRRAKAQEEEECVMSGPNSDGVRRDVARVWVFKINQNSY